MRENGQTMSVPQLKFTPLERSERKREKSGGQRKKRKERGSQGQEEQVEPNQTPEDCTPRKSVLLLQILFPQPQAKHPRTPPPILLPLTKYFGFFIGAPVTAGADICV